MTEWNARYSYSWPFRDVARGIWRKYPNAHAKHVVSVDVIDARLEDDGALRVERILGVEQSAPRWAMRVRSAAHRSAECGQILGSDQPTFVREVTWLVPSTANRPAPRVLQRSVNLSLAAVLSCDETVAYMPAAQDEGATDMHQLAVFRAHGTLGPEQTLAAVGRRLTAASVKRYSSNAEIGRRGFASVLAEPNDAF